MLQANPFAPPSRPLSTLPEVTRPAPPPPSEIAPIDVAEALETEAPPELDELVSQLLAQGAPVVDEDEAEAPRKRGGPGRMPGSPNKKRVLKYSHKALADAILLNPSLHNKQLAAIFGRSAQWVSLVKSSDAFQNYLKQREGEILDPTLRLSLEERARAITMRSMEVMAEKLDRPIDAIPDQFALRAFELATKASALGGNAPPPPALNPGEFLPELAKRLSALRSPSSAQPVIDVPSREVAPQE